MDINSLAHTKVKRKKLRLRSFKSDENRRVIAWKIYSFVVRSISWE